jgi:hypothetical protein
VGCLWSSHARLVSDGMLQLARRLALEIQPDRCLGQLVLEQSQRAFDRGWYDLIATLPLAVLGYRAQICSTKGGARSGILDALDRPTDSSPLMAASWPASPRTLNIGVLAGKKGISAHGGWCL